VYVTEIQAKTSFTLLLQICQLEMSIIIKKFMSTICIFSLFLLKFRQPFEFYVLTLLKSINIILDDRRLKKTSVTYSNFISADIHFSNFD